jgi:hypothetical protein
MLFILAYLGVWEPCLRAESETVVASQIAPYYLEYTTFDQSSTL